MFEAQGNTMQSDETQPEPAVSHAPVVAFGSGSPVVTLTTLALNVAIFFIMVARGVGFVNPTVRQVLPWGADFGPLTTSGQWWRLVTACYLHFGIIHIAMNMIILLQVGPFAERLFGRARYLALYLLAGIGGNIAGLYVHPLTVSAGASGAIFGIYGGILGFLLVRRGVVPTERAWAIARSAGIFLAYNLIYGLASARTDLAAHIGGLFVGFGVGCLLAWAGAAEPMRLLTVAVALAAVTVGAAARAPKSSEFATVEAMGVAGGNSVKSGKNDRVIYSGSATRADAEALSKALLVTRLFNGPDVTVLLRKDAGRTTVSMSLKGDESLSPTYDDVSSKLVNGQSVVTHTTKNRPPLPWNNPASRLFLSESGPVLASAVGGPPLTLELTNQKGEHRGELIIDAAAVMVGERDSVSYSGQATAAEATAMGAALVEGGYFQNQGARPALRKDEHGTVASFYFKDSGLQSSVILTLADSIGRQIAPAVGGLPLTVRLVGISGTATKDIPVR